MSERDKLEDIATMAENLYLTTSQEEKLLDMEADGASAHGSMDIIVVDMDTLNRGTLEADTPGVLAENVFLGGTEGDGETPAAHLKRVTNNLPIKKQIDKSYFMNYNFTVTIFIRRSQT